MHLSEGHRVKFQHGGLFLINHEGLVRLYALAFLEIEGMCIIDEKFNHFRSVVVMGAFNLGMNWSSYLNTLKPDSCGEFELNDQLIIAT
jgi:hypothetical protein